MRRYFSSEQLVVMPDKPFTRDLKISNKLAYVDVCNDKARIIAHNLDLEVPLSETEIARDDIGWFIDDMADFSEDDY